MYPVVIKLELVCALGIILPVDISLGMPVGHRKSSAPDELTQVTVSPKDVCQPCDLVGDGNAPVFSELLKVANDYCSALCHVSQFS